MLPPAAVRRARAARLLEGPVNRRTTSGRSRHRARRVFAGRWLLACVLLGVPAGASADLSWEKTGQVETLRHPPSPHWVWISDVLLERLVLMDADSGKFLGIINGGYGPMLPLFPTRRAEVYLPATYYSRRTRGERTDVLEIHDARTLAFIDEIELPAKRAIDRVALGHAALSDDDRFVAVFNWTPETSLSIVDVERRVFTEEIPISGCALVYAAGPRRFLSLCTDGAALVVTIGEDGRRVRTERTERFHDPLADPITEKAVRHGDRWLFTSFDGMVHEIDVSGPVRFPESWSLLDEADRGASWRIGGGQHLAVHERSGRFYSLVHRGEIDTHKEPGEEIWVYDLATRARVQRIALRIPGLTVYGFPIEPRELAIWPFGGMGQWLVDSLAPAVVHHIQVTQDAEPLLLTASEFIGALGVYDARSGRFTGRVQPTGWTSDLLLAPWGGPDASRGGGR
jgi:methylamine dehydrogenase heavy chain